ncbi:MAG: hypoxanthine phosphoribosyltransferase [Ktedonobacterales bacterium]|nr:hypoxanthine phosphoribosyltransferase [Ktedonobacterales bacterium]
MLAAAPIHLDIERVLLTEAQIQQRVRELGAQLSADYAGRTLTLVGVFAGATLFLADLIRAIDPTLKVHLDVVGVSSYGAGKTSNGRPTITQMPELLMFGRDVVLVEDIIDTGTTVAFLREQFQMVFGARSVRVCALLDKQPQLCRADYLGFACDPEFVVGYGLDYAEGYRGLSYVGVLKSRVYQTA